MKREERKRERGMYILEWMAVRGGGVAGIEEAEDNKSESKV